MLRSGDLIDRMDQSLRTLSNAGLKPVQWLISDETLFALRKSLASAISTERRQVLDEDGGRPRLLDLPIIVSKGLGVQWSLETQFGVSIFASAVGLEHDNLMVFGHEPAPRTTANTLH